MCTNSYSLYNRTTRKERAHTSTQNVPLFPRRNTSSLPIYKIPRCMAMFANCLSLSHHPALWMEAFTSPQLTPRGGDGLREEFRPGTLSRCCFRGQRKGKRRQGKITRLSVSLAHTHFESCSTTRPSLVF